MATVVFATMANQGWTRIVDATVSDVATTIDVDSAAAIGVDGISGSDFGYLTLVAASNWRKDPTTDPETYEIVKVTAVSVGGGAGGTDQLTITRAQDGTSGTAFAQDDFVIQRVCKIHLQDLIDALTDGTAELNFSATTGGITIGGSSTVSGNLNLDGGTDPELQVRDTASISASGAGTQLIDQSDTQAQLKKTAGGTGATQIDIDPISDATSAARVRYFRLTNTTGSKGYQFFKGDGTATIHNVVGVDGNDSYFQAGGGEFGVGTAAPTDLAHVGDGSTVRGVVGIDKGSGTTANMAYIRMQSADGTDYYLFIEDDGTVKVHTAVPSANTDGSEVGAQT